MGELADASGHYDWASMREKILDALSKLMQLNIQKLWDPPLVEDQFVT